MSRTRLALLAGLAAAAASGCSSKGASPTRVNFHQPSSIAMFFGKSLQDPANLRPYFAVANPSWNDLTLVDATNDTVVNAPVLLRPLAVVFPDRPALLASSSLGDGTGALQKADLLVGVTAGSSVLQLVRTWTAADTVDADAVTGQAVDLGADVLGIATLPAVAGTARLAVALSGEKLAVVQYRRSADGIAVERDPTYGTNGVVVHGLGLEALALATVPGHGVAPPDTAHVYAATRDPIGPGAVHGVAEIDVSTSVEPWPVRALDARGPTRLVAAAQLQERIPGDPVASIAPDASAFAGQPVVTRVYAVLDEEGCGPGRRIDCGIVALDPAKTPAAGDDNIPDDPTGWMPYRAPMQLPTRPLAIAIASPPAVGASGYESYAGTIMRLEANGTKATTAVAVVAGADNMLHFLDLGRFKVASATSAPVGAVAVVPLVTATSRLTLEWPDGHFATSDEAAGLVYMTPGWAADDSWTVTYQGTLPSLANRAAEAGLYAPGQPWLAVQIGDGTPGATGRTLNQVARLWHPALGVKVGDIVVFKAESFVVGGVQGCTGATPPGTSPDVALTTPKEFETTITAILPPDDARPGGAVVLGPRVALVGEPPQPTDISGTNLWAACFDALVAASSAGQKGLLASFDAAGLVLTGSTTGYAGRPQPGVEYVLQYKADPSVTGLPAWAYQDEDALAASCPLADWDGSWPAPAGMLDCGGAGCDPALCEQLVFARKARRRVFLAEDCTATPGATPDAACLVRWPAGTNFATLNGPELRFQVDHQVIIDPDVVTDPYLYRGLTLRFTTASGVGVLSANPGGASTGATGAIAFDRSIWDPGSGYRFLVTYPGDQVADVSPSVSPVASTVIR